MWNWWLCISKQFQQKIDYRRYVMQSLAFYPPISFDWYTPLTTLKMMHNQEPNISDHYYVEGKGRQGGHCWPFCCGRCKVSVAASRLWGTTCLSPDVTLLKGSLVLSIWALLGDFLPLCKLYYSQSHSEIGHIWLCPKPTGFKMILIWGEFNTCRMCLIQTCSMFLHLKLLLGKPSVTIYAPMSLF